MRIALLLTAALLSTSALASEEDAEPAGKGTVPADFDCDGSEEFCARLRKALELGEQLEAVLEPEVFEGVERVHRKDVEVRRYIKPELPVEWRVRHPEPVRCTYRVFIDEKGWAYDIRFLNCPRLFHASVAEAIQEAKWAPVRERGIKVKATFVDTVTFEKD